MKTLFGLGKKGQIESYFSIIVFLFVISISFILAFTILSSFVTQFQAAGFCPVDSSCDTAANGFMRGLLIWDNIIIIVVIILFIGIGLTSFKLPTKIAFFILSVVMAPFLGYVSYFFNYVFTSIVGNAAFDAIRAFFPKTILICTNFHWIALVAFIIGTITLYGKREPQQFVGGPVQ